MPARGFRSSREAGAERSPRRPSLPAAPQGLRDKTNEAQPLKPPRQGWTPGGPGRRPWAAAARFTTARRAGEACAGALTPQSPQEAPHTYAPASSPGRLSAVAGCPALVEGGLHAPVGIEVDQREPPPLAPPRSGPNQRRACRSGRNLRHRPGSHAVKRDKTAPRTRNSNAT